MAKFIDVAKNNYLNFLAGLIITAIFVIVIFLIYSIVSKENNRDNEFNVKIHINSEETGDSSAYYLKKADIDSLKYYCEKIENKIELLEKTKVEVLKLREEESFYNKIYTSFLALILAIAGFFGFKSIIELKKETIERAELEANKTASDKVDKVIEKRVAEITRKTIETSTKLIEDKTINYDEVNKETIDRIEQLEYLMKNVSKNTASGETTKTESKDVENVKDEKVTENKDYLVDETKKTTIVEDEDDENLDDEDKDIFDTK